MKWWTLCEHSSVTYSSVRCACWITWPTCSFCHLYFLFHILFSHSDDSLACACNYSMFCTCTHARSTRSCILLALMFEHSSVTCTVGGPDCQKCNVDKIFLQKICAEIQAPEQGSQGSFPGHMDMQWTGNHAGYLVLIILYMSAQNAGQV